MMSTHCDHFDISQQALAIAGGRKGEGVDPDLYLTGSLLFEECHVMSIHRLHPIQTATTITNGALTLT